jgi:O-antigen/teichoic acid export membrane protein
MRGDFFKASGARLFTVAASLASGLTNLKLYGHFFTPDVYGTIVVALQLISYLPMLDGGFRMATNRRLLASDSENRSGLILFSQEVYSWLLVLGLTTGTALMLLYAALPNSGAGSPLLFLSLGFSGALSVFAGAQAGLLLGLCAQTAMCVINGFSLLIGVGALALGFLLGLGLWAFPISSLTSAVFTYGSALAFLRARHVEVPLLHFSFSSSFRSLFRDILPEAWPAFRSQLAIVLIFSSDLVIASFFCKPAEVAIYGIVSRILAIARSFLQIFNETAWPFVAARAEGFERFQDGMVRANAWLYGLAAGGFVALLPWFVSWYMGPQWVPQVALCWLFAARFLVVGLAGPAAYFLFGKGDFRNVAKCTERELILSAALSLALSPHFGLIGIAISYLVGTAGGTLFPFWRIYTRLRGQSFAVIVASAWVRALTGFTVSWTVGFFVLLPIIQRGL